jgi:hypothetical protein
VDIALRVNIIEFESTARKYVLFSTGKTCKGFAPNFLPYILFPDDKEILRKNSVYTNKLTYP